VASILLDSPKWLTGLEPGTQIKAMAYQISSRRGPFSTCPARNTIHCYPKKMWENYRRRAPEVTNSLLFRVSTTSSSSVTDVWQGSLKEGFGFQTSNERGGKPTTCQGGEGSQLNGLAFTKDPLYTFIGSRHPIVSWQYFRISAAEACFFNTITRPTITISP
jgi:hypothetical protein